MSKKPKCWGDIYVKRSLIKSEAFKALSGKSHFVLLHFLGKRQMKKLKRLDSRGAKWRIANNGQIVFTYKEAAALGISQHAFTRALDQLVEVGLLDITESGSGLRREVSLYALSDRWRAYGTPRFEERRRLKGRQWVTSK